MENFFLIASKADYLRKLKKVASAYGGDRVDNYRGPGTYKIHGYYDFRWRLNITLTLQKS